MARPAPHTSAAPTASTPAANAPSVAQTTDRTTGAQTLQTTASAPSAAGNTHHAATPRTAAVSQPDTTHSEPVDSAALTAAATTADLSTALPFQVYGTADSLRTRLSGADIRIPREVAAEEIFGRSSVAADPLPFRTQQTPLIENPAFQGFVLVLATLYALLLYHNLNDVRQLMRRISRDSAARERLTEDPKNSGFSRFLNTTVAIGLLFAGVIAIKLGDRFLADFIPDSLPWGVVPGLSLLIAVGCGVILLSQLLTLRLAGEVVLAQPFVTQLLQLKRTYFSLSVILLAPALLLYVLCPEGTGSAWLFIIAAGLVITALLYLKETLFLFISKKVSILHWFLYLCGVEILPFSFLWLLAAR